VKLLPRPLPVLFCALVALSGSASVFAQDVRVTPPAWVDSRDNPDELPSFKKVPQIVFPEELRQTSDIGYVVRELGARMKKGRALVAIAPIRRSPVSRAVAAKGSEWSFNPGRARGQGGEHRDHRGVHLQPGLGRRDCPTPTPRLLEVTPVVLPWPKGKKAGDSVPDFVVCCRGERRPGRCRRGGDGRSGRVGAAL